MSRLRDIIRREIDTCGPMTFARFMELSLYCPDFGFYERITNTPGRRGHYLTSVSVGPLFGELLALQFAQWLGRLAARGSSGDWNGKIPHGHQIVEAGAQDGRLAADILRWFKLRRRQWFERLEYWILEPSLCRQQWQRRTLEPFAGRVRWFASWEKLPPSGVRGIIFSNELLDALPVHRLGWNAAQKTWFEWGVNAADGDLVWCKLPLAKTHRRQAADGDAPGARPARRIAHLPDLPAPLLAVLPDGFLAEICPAAADWWRQAAAALKGGWLLTLDYGSAHEPFVGPERAQGTLRAYYRHRSSADLLANAGDQDLTAHVDFSALQRAGESAGLKTAGLLSQEKFLTPIAAAMRRDEAALGEWTAAHTRQFQTLTHPEHLGRSFQALVQTR